jgi:hypothetical protein
MATYNLGLGDLFDKLIITFTNTKTVHEEKYCERCNMVTEHVSVGSEEGMESLARQDGLSDLPGPLKALRKGVANLYDWNPVNIIIGGKYYRCRKCNRVRQ